MKVIITGGGTGGHIYPALAIAEGIKERVPDVDLLYVGTEKGLEASIVPRTGLKFQTIDITGIDRSSMLKASRSLVSFPKSFFQGWDIVRDFKPDIIVGTGGYVSFPVVMAGTFTPCKTYIHEQNAVLGLANRNLARRVNGVLLTFEEAANGLKAPLVKVTGLPVRKEIFEVDLARARAELDLRDDSFTLLVFGGSRGAMSINRAMIDFITRSHNDAMQVIWITGETAYNETLRTLNNRVDINHMRCKLLLSPYMYNIPDAMAVSDLAVCRAGASTLCELALLGLPAVLIPYPYAAENHQEKNARAWMDKNAVDMIIDEFLDGDTLYNKVFELKDNSTRLKQMSSSIKREGHPEALKDILDIILQ